ncbi:hypothetical protein SDC9_113111 [bioreactor metagenome]|uniref:Uncharacterized protein n=1 Tax=bioreactor metagenome TaxID=1076179 RepID=A0A645BWS6_9ZZZZ
MTIPANNGRNNSVAISMKIVSEVAAVVNAIGNIARPIRPIRTDAVSESVVQMMPMRRDCLISSAERIAIKRNSTCGIPK